MNENKYRILIIGGYGTFGRYITEELAKNSLIHLTIAGRSIEKANRFVRELIGKGRSPQLMKAVALDILSEQLNDYLAYRTTDLVINASGPFQEQDYRVARTCINNNCHYLDIADGREFVANIDTLNKEAKDKKVSVISGASSVPGLSSAVIDHHMPYFSQMDSLYYGISPGNKADRGEATVKAILGYTGKSFTGWRNGREYPLTGWQQCQSVVFSQPIGRRWMANCNIPDLSLLPRHYPTLKNVHFQAGLELKVLHFAMWAMSLLAYLKIVKDWSRYAKFFTALSRYFMPFGSDDGGMILRIDGVDHNHSPLSFEWQLIALDGDGPRIPSMAAVILANRFAQGDPPPIGAQPCLSLFTLDEFRTATQAYNITDEVRWSAAAKSTGPNPASVEVTYK